VTPALSLMALSRHPVYYIPCLLCCGNCSILSREASVGKNSVSPHLLGRSSDSSLRLEEQTWQGRQIELGCGRDITLDWAELRRRVSMTDARLLLRTTALDLAIREKFVVFDLGVLRGYVDCDRCVLLLPTPTDIQLDGTTSLMSSMREHIAHVETHILEALSRPGGRRLSFTMVVVESLLEEVSACIKHDLVYICNALYIQIALRHIAMRWENSRGLNGLSAQSWGRYVT